MTEITNEYIQNTVLSNGTLLNMFPFLSTLRQAKLDLDTCPGCQKGAKGEQFRSMLSETKRKIAQMSDKDAETFKKVLGLGSIVIFYPAQVNGMFIRQKRVF